MKMRRRTGVNGVRKSQNMWLIRVVRPDSVPLWEGEARLFYEKYRAFPQKQKERNRKRRTSSKEKLVESITARGDLAVGTADTECGSKVM